MTTEAIQAVEETIKLCLDARERLGPHGTREARVLLDLVLLDLGRALAKMMAAVGR